VAIFHYAMIAQLKICATGKEEMKDLAFLQHLGGGVLIAGHL